MNYEWSVGSIVKMIVCELLNGEYLELEQSCLKYKWKIQRQ